MNFKACAAVLSLALLISGTLQPVGDANAFGSNDSPNSVAEYLNDATQDTRGDDHCEVLEQALRDMLDLPVDRLRQRTYPDYEMRPHAWSVTVVLERYLPPGGPQMIGDDKFFDDLNKPEAKLAIRRWSSELNRECGSPQGVRPRDTVKDFLSAAEVQYESDRQKAVILLALTDMIEDPVKVLRNKRYPDYQMHPQKWRITQILDRYFVPDPSYAGFVEDEFFRDVKKPEAQEAIQMWLDRLNSRDDTNGPQANKTPSIDRMRREISCHAAISIRVAKLYSNTTASNTARSANRAYYRQ
jgi:hypothetical protein